MRQPRCAPTAFAPGRSLGWCAVVLALVLPRLTAAGPAGFDPVAGLRQALQMPAEGSDGLTRREESLRRWAAGLCRAPELREALLLREWRTEDADERVAAVDQAVRAALARRFEGVVADCLRHGGTADRLAAANMLAETAAALRGAGVRGWTLRGLAPALAEQVRGPNMVVREAAARALGRISADPAIAVPALSNMARAGEPVLRRAAARALVELVRTGAAGLRGRREAPGATGRVEMLHIGRLVVPAAGEGLGDGDPEVRRLSVEAVRLAVFALEALVADALPGGPPASEQSQWLAVANVLKGQTDRLRAAARDPDAAVRFGSSQTLQALSALWSRLAPDGSGPQGRGGVAVAVLQERQPGVGQPILQGLQAALPDLSAGVNDPDVRVRRVTVEALEMLGKEGVAAVPALVRALLDPDLFVRWAAARTLGRLAPAREDVAVPGLQRLLNDPDLDVRLAAAVALRQYGPAAQGAVPALMEAVRCGRGETRLAALEAIGSIGAAAEAAIPAVAVALRSNEVRARRTAARILGRFGPQALGAREALREAMLDDDVEVRKAASDALLDILPPAKPEFGANWSKATPPAPPPGPQNAPIWQAAHFAPAVSLRPPVAAAGPVASERPPVSWAPRLLPAAAVAAASPLLERPTTAELPPTVWQAAAPTPVPVATSPPGGERPASVALRQPVPMASTRVPDRTR